MSNSSLSSLELQRYQRQIILPEIGLNGQTQLKNAKVLIIGAGGLGSPLLYYLAAAGIGTLGVIDADIVSLTNLHRQILYTAVDIGETKVQQAKIRVQALNPEVNIHTYPENLTVNNAVSLFSEYDLIIDGSDNFPTRYLVNDACVVSKKPFIAAAIYRFEAQLGVFNYQASACYRCLYPEPPPAGLIPNCAEAGVLGVLPGIVGCWQANEALKLLLGIGELLTNQLLLIDTLNNNIRRLNFTKNRQCLSCSQPQFQLLEETSYMDNRLCTINQHDGGAVAEITALELKQLLDEQKDIQIIDVREAAEYQISHIDGLLFPLSLLRKDPSAILPYINNHAVVVMHCLHGIRSIEAIRILRPYLADTQLVNLKGGLKAWQQQVDPNLVLY